MVIDQPQERASVQQEAHQRSPVPSTAIEQVEHLIRQRRKEALRYGYEPFAEAHRAGSRAWGRQGADLRDRPVAPAQNDTVSCAERREMLGEMRLGFVYVQTLVRHDQKLTHLSSQFKLRR